MTSASDSNFPATPGSAKDFKAIHRQIRKFSESIQEFRRLFDDCDAAFQQLDSSDPSAVSLLAVRFHGARNLVATAVEDGTAWLDTLAGWVKEEIKYRERHRGQ